MMDCETIQKRHLADEYRAGRLTAEEAEDYERHFFACDRCFAELRFQDHVADRIRDEGGALFRTEISGEQSGKEQKSGRRALLDPVRLRSSWASLGLRVGAVAVAAVVVILAVGRLSDHSSAVRDLWTPTAHPYVPSELRSDTRSSDFHRGMKAYHAGLYEEAVDWLRRCAPDTFPNGEAPFYIGVSLLMMEDARGAEQALRSAVERVPSSALYRWYLAQAVLKQGRVDMARNELNRIVDGGGEFAIEAQALLQRIAETQD